MIVSERFNQIHQQPVITNIIILMIGINALQDFHNTKYPNDMNISIN